MHPRFTVVPVALVAAVLGSGCLSALPFTTAHTLAPGHVEVETSAQVEATPTPEGPHWVQPSLDAHVGVRVGVVDRLDAQIRLSPLGEDQLILKLQAIRSPHWNFAIAAVGRLTRAEANFDWGGGGRLVLELDQPGWPDLVLTGEAGAVWETGGGAFVDMWPNPYGPAWETYATASFGPIFHVGPRWLELQPEVGIACRRRTIGEPRFPPCVPQLGLAAHLGGL